MIRLDRRGQDGMATLIAGFTLKKCTESAALGENDEFSHEFGGKPLTKMLPN